MNPILTNAEVGILTVFDGLHHIETPLLADYIRAIEQAISVNHDKKDGAAIISG